MPAGVSKKFWSAIDVESERRSIAQRFSALGLVIKLWDLRD
jgi:hypothetical protein